MGIKLCDNQKRLLIHFAVCTDISADKLAHLANCCQKYAEKYIKLYRS